MLKLVDDRLLAATQSAYLALLDRTGLLKGDALAALVVAHLALSPLSAAAVGFKLVCLLTCLKLSALQRSQRFGLVNSMAEWLRGMPLLRLAMACLALAHVVNEPSGASVAAQIVALAAAYLFCAKVRERRNIDVRVGLARPDFA